MKVEYSSPSLKTKAALNGNDCWSVEVFLGSGMKGELCGGSVSLIRYVSYTLSAPHSGAFFLSQDPNCGGISYYAAEDKIEVEQAFASMLAQAKTQGYAGHGEL